jgi:hypothetical protein
MVIFILYSLQIKNQLNKKVFSVSRLSHEYIITNSFSKFNNTSPQNSGITLPQNDFFFQCRIHDICVLLSIYEVYIKY